ncbi:hypothetical protein QUF64_04460 [Anaerolineales bacterium HSG6]|nr:hypothetical protein [Anaerolineales bacterium HSG6]
MKQTPTPYPLFIVSLIGLILLTACSDSTPTAPVLPEGTGQLDIKANGESFVRDGFISKDGWQIQFDHLYLTLADVTAYQTSPPFEAISDQAPTGPYVAVSGPITLDLVTDDGTDESILIGRLSDVPTGHYNALSWQMLNASTDPAQGYTILFQGQAKKGTEAVDFRLKIEQTYRYHCGEYVGDSRKGILGAGGTANLEATFHIDHIFGSADTAPNEALNQGALGFEPLAQLATNSQLEVDLAQLKTMLSATEFKTLTDNLSTLGHVGEGHCYEQSGGYTGHNP